MKTIRFVLFFAITLALTVFLDRPYDKLPPLGKLLSPKHGFWQNAEADSIGLEAVQSLPGLQDEVIVSFDKNLIPHIYAKNDEDLFFAQGYVTAYHRLWQMEFQLLATAGRLSSIFGEQALEFDRTQRRKGLTYGAKRGLEELKKDDESYALTQAYVRGVNAYIDQLDYADLPIEYKLLDYEPEPWTAFKCALLLKEMSDQLSKKESDLQNTNALKLWGKDLFDILFPETHPGLDPVVPRGTKFDFEPIKVAKPDVDFPLIISENIVPGPDEQNGSNSFIVNGKKTADGSVLFSNETDLVLNLPNIWYLAHLNSPTYNVIGGTLPGSPTVIVGFNDSIAWGDTNAKRDLVDWYYIAFKNDKRDEYQYDKKWLKTEKVVEAIKIKGKETYYDTVIYTHYGPVMYDRNFRVSEEQINLAMRWTAHDPSEEFRTFFLLNKAKNYQDFLEAYSYYTGPPQNVSFASASGDIAIRISGKFPVKWEEQGKFIMDGRDSRFEWQTYMPWAHVYESLNPPRNFVSSANQHPGDSTYPYYDYDAYFEHFRNRRINDRLKAMTDMTEQDMMDLQHDNFNYIAADVLPLMLDSLMRDSLSWTNEERAIINDLRAWDYFNEAEVKAATVFELWWDEMRTLLWDEFDEQEVELIKPRSYNTIYLLKNRPDLSFVDYQKTPQTETTGMIFRMAFKNALQNLRTWQETNGEDYAWYRFKNTSINHLIPPMKPFSAPMVKVGGNHNIVNAISERHGAAIRLIVKLGKEGNKGWVVYPGSQTGNPGNKTYAGMIASWADGTYYPLLLSDSPPAQDGIYTLTLKPN